MGITINFTTFILICIASIIVDLIKDGFIYLIKRKEKKEMAVAYATLIINGKKSFADVPVNIKEQVKQVLIDLDCGFLAE